jgi:hypothetical protein
MAYIKYFLLLILQIRFKSCYVSQALVAFRTWKFVFVRLCQRLRVPVLMETSKFRS